MNQSGAFGFSGLIDSTPEEPFQGAGKLGDDDQATLRGVRNLAHDGVNARFTQGHVASYLWTEIDQNTENEEKMLESWFQLG